jgi:integrase
MGDLDGKTVLVTSPRPWIDAVIRPAHRYSPTDRFFTSPTGKPMLDHTIWRIVSRARESAGLPHFRPYDLRHSHASLLINLGAHPKAISERMGRTEIGVTMNVYGHLFEGAQGQLTKDLDDLLERSRPKTLGEGGKRADGA